MRFLSCRRTGQTITLAYLVIGVIGCRSGDDRSARVQRDTTGLGLRLAAVAQGIEEKRRLLNVPGVAVAIVQDDRVLMTEGFGLRNQEALLPVTSKTLFAIGSCTKPFTALAAVISADEGRLSLDDPPRKFLPYFRMRDPQASANVSLRDLLSHRTGLMMYESDAGWYERYPGRERVIKFAMMSKPVGKLRERFQYNNFMYLAAGEAIAVAHHSAYETVIATRIFQPLGMRSSNLSLSAMQKSGDFSYGYGLQKSRPRFPLGSLRFLDGIAPAGAINSNAEDLAQWLRLMLGAGTVDGKRLVSKAGFQQMLEPAIATAGGHYGLGLYIENWHGHTTYYHPGGVTGFSTRCEFVPQLGLAFVILTNVDDNTLPKQIREVIYANLVASE
jgi:CubicO group peptidase (beta-lactamase class C family)